MALKAEEVYAILKKQIQFSGATPEQIQQAVDAYLEENPVQPGATEEQAAQIEQNKLDIYKASENLDDLATFEVSYNLYNPDAGSVGHYINSSGKVVADVAWTSFIVSDLIDVSGFDEFVCANLKPAQIGLYNKSGEFIERLTGDASISDTPISLSRVAGKSEIVRVTYDMTQGNYSKTMVYGGSDIGKPYKPYGEKEIAVKENVKIINAQKAENASVSDSIKYNCYNKNILIIGDSIMTYNTDVGKVAHNIELILASNKIVDVAVAGATWCDDSEGVVYDGNPSIGNKNFIGNQIQKIINEYESNPDYQGFDICIIGAGTNDGLGKFGWNVNRDGKWIDITDDMIESQFTGNSSAFETNEYIQIDNIDRTTIYGAMRWSIEKIREIFPNIKIYISLPIQAAPTVKTGVAFAKKTNLIRRISDRLSVTAIDTQNCGIYGKNETKGENGKYLSDGLHPNDIGGVLMAKYICKKIILDYIE